MLDSNDARQEPGGHFSNVAEALDPTFQSAPRPMAEEVVSDDSDKAGGGKSAPIVPPLKRKASKDAKNKKFWGKWMLQAPNMLKWDFSALWKYFYAYYG